MRTDFGRLHRLNPDIIHLSEKIGRTPSAVALKLSNLAAVDESLPRKGMANASALDRVVWKEFLINPEPVLRIHLREPISDGTRPDYDFPDAASRIPGFGEGKTRFANVPQRVGQNRFRDWILTSYQRRCALTGIEDVHLLNASHIVGWAKDVKNRLNPHNGICLNALHDRAFDKHLISFDESNNVLISESLPKKTKSWFQENTAKKMELPVRFLPSPELLAKHREVFFQHAS